MTKHVLQARVNMRDKHIIGGGGGKEIRTLPSSGVDGKWIRSIDPPFRSHPSLEQNLFPLAELRTGNRTKTNG